MSEEEEVSGLITKPDTKLEDCIWSNVENNYNDDFVNGLLHTQGCFGV